MSYQSNVPYYMVSHAGAGIYLSTSGSNNVCLHSAKEQSWRIATFDARDKIVSDLNQAFALNYPSANSGSASVCDVVAHFGNDAHTCVTLTAVNAPSNIYKIKLKNYNLYLTATGLKDGDYVRWEPPVSSGSTQQWRFLDSQSGSDTRILPMPSGPRCNWNQKHSGVTSLFDVNACTLVSGLDVANFYATDGVGYTPASMNSTIYWQSDAGYTWRVPGSGAFTGTIFKRAEYSEDSLRAKVKEQIDIGCPPVIDIGPDGKHSHTMFCYGYKNGAATNEDIYVFDPANMDTSDIEGRNVTLANAMIYNNYSNIRNIRPTHRT